jgi:type III secretion protein U
VADTSEEKSQPATKKKLKEARDKGQVAKSQDMVSGVVILFCTLCLTVMVPRAQAQITSLLDLVAGIYTQPFGDTWPRVLDSAEQVLISLTLPMVAITVGAVILTNIVIQQGFVFSVEPIKPDIKHINPFEGFKRLFALRNLVEFLKALFKVSCLALALYGVGRYSLQALMEASRCGAGCIESTFYQVLKPLMITVIGAFLVLGGVDVLVQRWLFVREMKMTRSEHKRERKDQDGDPLIKRARTRQRQEMQAMGGATGLARASLVLIGREGVVVGLRYVRGETPVPLVVCRADAEDGPTMRQQARQQGTLEVHAPDLAADIARRSVPGEPIPDTAFQAVADILVAARLI